MHDFADFGFGKKKKTRLRLRRMDICTTYTVVLETGGLFD
jgi:hypothetical protein